MDSRTGIVMKIEKNIAYIMTTSGEFTKIKIDKNKPSPTIGSEYCGSTVKNTFMKTNMLRYTAAACLAFIILLTGGGAYAYNKPVSTVTVSINPAIELKSNIWNKVISITPLNSDGKKIIQEISLKNKEIDDALVSILNQAKKDKFIDEDYKKMDKIITVNISGKELKIPAFQNEIKKDDLSLKVDSNGSTILNNSSKKNKNTTPTNNTYDKSSELNKQTDNKNTINSSNESIDNSNPSNINDNNNKNNTNGNSDNKQNNNDILNHSDKSKANNYNDKNSSKNDNWIKDDTNFEHEDDDKKYKKDHLNNSDKKYHDSKKKEKKEKKD